MSSLSTAEQHILQTIAFQRQACSRFLSSCDVIEFISGPFVFFALIFPFFVVNPQQNDVRNCVFTVPWFRPVLKKAPGADQDFIFALTWAEQRTLISLGWKRIFSCSWAHTIISLLSIPLLPFFLLFFCFCLLFEPKINSSPILDSIVTFIATTLTLVDGTKGDFHHFEIELSNLSSHQRLQLLTPKEIL